MIARLRERCQRDDRVIAGLLYGSFTHGEGDQFSDIEAALFIEDESLAQLDQIAWLEHIAPVALYFADDFGHHTAIFTNLIRGEFHFEPASRLAIIETWQGNAWYPEPEAAILVDRTGGARRYLQSLSGGPPERDTPACAQSRIANFLNLILFGASVLARGEMARSLELLGGVHRILLQMARLAENTTEHWPTPSRCAEQDLPEATYGRYVACTTALQQEGLWQAYRTSLAWGKELMGTLAPRHGLTLPVSLITAIEVWLTDPPGKQT